MDTLPDFFVSFRYHTSIESSICRHAQFLDVLNFIYVVAVTYVPMRKGILLNSISTAIQFEIPPEYSLRGQLSVCYNDCR